MSYGGRSANLGWLGVLWPESCGGLGFGFQVGADGGQDCADFEVALSAKV